MAHVISILTEYPEPLQTQQGPEQACALHLSFDPQHGYRIKATSDKGREVGRWVSDCPLSVVESAMLWLARFSWLIQEAPESLGTQAVLDQVARPTPLEPRVHPRDAIGVLLGNFPPKEPTSLVTGARIQTAPPSPPVYPAAPPRIAPPSAPLALPPGAPTGRGPAGTEPGGSERETAELLRAAMRALKSGAPAAQVNALLIEGLAGDDEEERGDGFGDFVVQLIQIRAPRTGRLVWVRTDTGQPVDPRSGDPTGAPLVNPAGFEDFRLSEPGTLILHPDADAPIWVTPDTGQLYDPSTGQVGEVVIDPELLVVNLASTPPAEPLPPNPMRAPLVDPRRSIPGQAVVDPETGRRLRPVLPGEVPPGMSPEAAAQMEAMEDPRAREKWLKGSRRQQELRERVGRHLHRTGQADLPLEKQRGFAPGPVIPNGPGVAPVQGSGRFLDPEVPIENLAPEELPVGVPQHVGPGQTVQRLDDATAARVHQENLERARQLNQQRVEAGTLAPEVASIHEEHLAAQIDPEDADLFDDEDLDEAALDAELAQLEAEVQAEAVPSNGSSGHGRPTKADTIAWLIRFAEYQGQEKKLKRKTVAELQEIVAAKQAQLAAGPPAPPSV